MLYAFGYVADFSLMEILERKKDGFEIVPSNVSDNDMRDEVNRRTARAGYTTRSGEAPYRTKIMIRPPSKKYEENYVRIFGHE